MASLGSGGIPGGITVLELNDSPRPIDFESSRDILATSMLSKSLSEPSRDQRSSGTGGRAVKNDPGADGYSIGQMQSKYGGGASGGEMDSQAD